jgi:CBS domain-containing protein
MRARDLMTSPVITISVVTPIKAAARLLMAHGFTALPVVDDDDRLVGIVTEADLIRDRIPRDTRFRQGESDTSQHHSAQVLVGSVMTTPATAMGSGADLTDLCQTLVDGHIRAVPVVDDSRVVGIVTRGDIVRVLARDDGVIAADILHRLEIYGGPNRWTVTVHDGVVRIVDAFDYGPDRHVASLLAQAVPGVVDTRTVSTANGRNER